MAWFVVLFVVSMAPGFFILWFVYHSVGAGRREITQPVLITFLAGCIAVLPAALIEGVAVPHVQNIVTGSVPGALVTALCVVAPTEELSKLLALGVALGRRGIVENSGTE